MTYTIAARDATADQVGISMTTVSAVTGGIGKYYAEKAEAIISCQAFAEYGSSSRFAELLDAGGSFSDFISTLEATDEFFSYKQIGIVERTGNIEVYTGSSCSNWAGHIIGEDYLVFGNVLAGAQVVDAMARAFEDSRGQPLAERLLLSIEAGKAAGGQSKSGQPIPESSSMIRVHDYKADSFVFAGGKLPVLDLRVDLDIDPVAKLRRIYGPVSALMETYVERYGRNPAQYVSKQPAMPELAMHASQF